MLWILFLILVLAGLLGVSFHVAGGLIQLLLGGALILLMFNLLSGSKRTA